MSSHGLLDEIEFQKLIEGADPLTRAALVEARATRTVVTELKDDVASLRVETSEAFKLLPCRTGDPACPPSGQTQGRRGLGKPILYAGISLGGAGAVAGWVELIRSLIAGLGQRPPG